MDLSKLRPEHREIVSDFINDKFGVGYTQEAKEKMYNIYLALADIPKKDWNKPSAKVEIEKVVE